MSQAFAGTLLLPGEEGPGLDAVIETVATDIKLVSGENELGSWTQEECAVTPAGEGAFTVVLGDEKVLFVPDAPIQFAEAMTEPEPPEATPLAARIEAVGKPVIGGQTTKIEPLKSVGKDDVLSRSITLMIIAASFVLSVALLVLSVTI